jgi:hypothetical protein
MNLTLAWPMGRACIAIHRSTLEHNMKTHTRACMAMRMHACVVTTRRRPKRMLHHHVRRSSVMHPARIRTARAHGRGAPGAAPAAATRGGSIRAPPARAYVEYYTRIR